MTYVAPDFISTPDTPRRTPDEILADLALYDAVASDQVPPPTTLAWEVIRDVFDSFQLAIEDTVDSPEMVVDIMDTVVDYLTNHWGDS